MPKRPLIRLIAAALVTGGVLSSLFAMAAAISTPRAAATGRAVRAVSAPARLAGNGSPALANARPAAGDPEDDWDHPAERDAAYYGLRVAGTNRSFTMADAAAARARAAESVLARSGGPSVLSARQAAFGGAWTAAGPEPIIQNGGRYLRAVSGRIGALAVRSTPPYTIYLGAAQGGLWVSSTLTNRWLPRTDALPTQAMGAIALAPSNEDVVYVGTGEGALSGDSYFADGVYRSDNGGRSFRRVSQGAIDQVSVAKLVVDPANPDHVFAATLRGIRGSAATGAPSPSDYGVWETTDGGKTWIPRLATRERSRGATDLVLDPRNPKVIYASFWMQGLVKSIDGGQTWQDISGHFPMPVDWGNANVGTRIALDIAHPDPNAPAILYAGFDWADPEGKYHPSTVFKSVDDGQTWAATGASVTGYCGGQCSYDNVIMIEPGQPDTVYALGLWDYGHESGGVYRTMDGGTTWLDIGYGQHPDFHAIAIRRDDPRRVVIGNDGGVWSSANRGGRMAGEPYTRTEWVNLNGFLDDQGAVTARTGLQITQFSSIAQHPAQVKRLYGGSQDNGTERKSLASNTWVDIASGDGGKVLVDPNDPRFVYGTYYDLSPYRFSDGMLGGFGTNESITRGITTSERSAFYVPFVMDPEFTNRLYIGSFRLYRTDNRGDLWQAASGDLTSGCANSRLSPTGYGCVITAIGVTAGAPAVYTGSGDGRVYLTADATVDHPAWTRVDAPPLPVRPVGALAVDRSDYRVAYVAFSGFNAATPTQPGHVFRTQDGGKTWRDISGDLPDMPVNALVLDASNPDTVYAGTDVGPMVTTDGGHAWRPLGTGFPLVSVEGLDLNPYTRQIAVGTHGRGAYVLRDDTTTVPALRVRAFASDVPAGPGSLVTYTVRVRNTGNAAATGVQVRDPVPARTDFVGGPGGATLDGGTVVWPDQTVPVSGTVAVTFTVRVQDVPENQPGPQVVNDGLHVSAREGVAATGSPLAVTLAAPYAVALTPDSQVDGTRAGQSITYTLRVENRGYRPAAFDLAATGDWPTALWDGQFQAEQARTPVLAPGQGAGIGLWVAVPADAADSQPEDTAVTATSAAQADVGATAMVQTLAATAPVLIVDGDGDQPDVQAYYRDAVRAAGYRYEVWDVAKDPRLPRRYLAAHPVVVGYTGTSYPDPIGPYEAELADYLDHGGRLFLSGWDILDQSAGTAPFVRKYLHVDWDGEETQNDLGTAYVNGVAANPVTRGLGKIELDHTVLADNDFSDEITPIAPALPAFTDDKDQPDALTVTDGAYRVMFLAFPFEALTGADHRNEVMARALDYLGQVRRFVLDLPLLLRNPHTSPW
jgi:uncharacterized repeat protein (TIGR01451 family)